MNQSLKKYMVLIFSALVNNDLLESSKLLLVTPFGVVTGTPVLKPLTSELGKIKLRESTTKDIVRFFADKSEKNYSFDSIANHDSLSETDGYILLEDVEIQGAAFNNVYIPSLLVFFDQIVALSIKKMDPY